LERHFRDIHVAVQHNSAFRAQYESAGKVLMGLHPARHGLVTEPVGAPLSLDAADLYLGKRTSLVPEEHP
jgi:hypothetical protein